MKSEENSWGSGVKRIIATLLTAVLVIASSAAAFAQELKLKGEAKSGVYWEQTQNPGDKPVTKVRMHSKDDAGDNPDNHQGRFQLDLDYDNGKGLGMKTRIRWQALQSNSPELWQYAFGYGNFFQDQMTVSVGKLGASPWGSGGPEMWKELEVGGSGGMRMEIKPSILPGLNVGFVLNTYNQVTDTISAEKRADANIFHMLQESVLGISYTHDLFHVRFAYRFDSDRDCSRDLDADSEDAGKEDEFLYRIEEHVIADYLPGLRVWAMGYFQGVSSDNPDYAYFRNWLFAEYDPGMFTAQTRFGYDWIPNRSLVYIKPSFYWNFLERMISVGAAFTYGQDFGEGKMFEGSPYLYIELEPKVQFNIPGSDSYIAFIYNWKREYLHMTSEIEDKGVTQPIKQTQWINLRFCLRF